jgi:hypothetical protein
MAMKHLLKRGARRSWLCAALFPFLALSAGKVRADSFVFEWNLLTGDYGADPVFLDLDGDAVPKKVWGALGEVGGVPQGDFPATSAWLFANYGPFQGYEDMIVSFRFGTADTSQPHVFELDPASFSSDPAKGTARMTYLPAGGAGSVPVSFYLGGRDSSQTEELQEVAKGHVTEVRLEMNPGLGWSGFGSFFFDESVAALGPGTMTQAPLFSEVAALVGSSAPFRMPITIGGLDFDAEAQEQWENDHPVGQVPDARVLLSLGAGYAGEPSGVTQSLADVILPSNGTLVSRDGEYHFDPRDLDRLGRWFDPPMVSEYSYRTRDGSSFSAVGLPEGIDTVDGKFTIWFDGTSRVVDEGVFFSFRDHRESGGNLVKSFRISGIEPEVDAADPQAFPIRLAFWNGSEPLRSASFSIRPAIVYQPDNLIGTSSSPARARGNGIYNRSGAGQSIRVVARGAKRVSAFLHMQNDGEASDRIRLRGTKGNRLVDVAYLSGGNRTALVARGAFSTAALDPGRAQVVRINLRSSGKRRVSKTLSLLSTSRSDGAKVDLAKTRFFRR